MFTSIKGQVQFASQSSNDEMTGGQVIARTLIENGISRGFCVPGESFTGLLNALDAEKDKFDLVVCRHEGGASYMAEAYGRVKGRPGVCLVTRGVGASNAMIGVTTAMQDSTPMLLIMGHASTGTKGHFSFQEMDPKAVFCSVAKWVGEVERASDIPYMINRALKLAISGRPGPVVLAIPDNLQFATVSCNPRIKAKQHVMAPTVASIEQIGALLSNSSKPIVIAGGTGWNQEACEDLASFTRNYDLPLTTTFRRNDLIANDNPQYIGSLGPGANPALLKWLQDSDLVLLLGGRLSEIETRRYTDLSSVTSDRIFVHAAPLFDEFGELLEPNLAITTAVEPLCKMLKDLSAPASIPWNTKRNELRESFVSHQEPVDFGDKLNPANAVIALQKELPGDAVVTMGAGNYTHFVLRHHRFTQFGTLFASLCAPMGHSVPAAISIAMEQPETEVVSYVGDGCYFMNHQELVIAAKRNLRLTVVMFNNGIYSSIRMHQEIARPGMAVATTLDNPDFQMLAKSLGLESRQVTRAEDVATAYSELRRETDGPIFIELLTDPEVITPQKMLSQIRGAGK